MRFTAVDVRVIGQEIDDAIEAVLEKHGLRAAPHRITYGPTLTYKVEISKVDLDENGFDRGSPAAIEWLTLGNYKICSVFNAWGTDNPAPFTAEQALGCEFTSQGRRFRLVGMNQKARKYPLLGEEIGTGKRYKFQPGVLRTLKAEVSA